MNTKVKKHTVRTALMSDQKSVNDTWNSIAKDFILPTFQLNDFVEYGNECELKLEQYKKCRDLLSKNSAHYTIVNDIVNLLESEIKRNNDWLKKQQDRMEELERLRLKFEQEKFERQQRFNIIILGFLITIIVLYIFIYTWSF